MKKKKLYKRLLVLAVILYASFTLINQQKVINQYSKNSDDLSSQIEEEKSTNQKLLAQKEDVNSKEYSIETPKSFPISVSNCIMLMESYPKSSIKLVFSSSTISLFLFTAYLLTK